MFGTPKPMWFTEVPFVPPDGARLVMKISTFGNLTISAGLVPTLTIVPPSSVQNFFCSSRLETLRWWWPYTIGPSLAAVSCADAVRGIASSRSTMTNDSTTGEIADCRSQTADLDVQISNLHSESAIVDPICNLRSAICNVINESL